MTTVPKRLRLYETRSAKHADPATAALVEDIGLARETDYLLMADQLKERVRLTRIAGAAMHIDAVMPEFRPSPRW